MDFKQWEPIIGLEIHAQLKTKTKMFSSDGAFFDERENSEISPVSLGLPGTLPLLNEQALMWALKTAKAFKGRIQNKNIFARKNYFYPDLPKGYQISQYDKPFCQGGEVKYFYEGEVCTISLERIHMEEDAGRSLHKGHCTLINFNRAGVPLLEIVTKPEIKHPQSAALCAKSIRRVLRYLEVCDGNLEEGSLRCDCNVSLRKKGSQALGVKVEIKNINSFRFIEKALQYEIERQMAHLNSSQKIIQETRLYDSVKNQTLPMRSKEESSDYRYFPDPDLLPVEFEEAFVENLKLPELPFERAERFKKEYQIQKSIIDLLVEDKKMADYFEHIATQTKDPQTASSWIVGDLQAQLKEHHLSIEKCPVSAKHLIQLIELINAGDVSTKMAKDIFALMWETQKSPQQIVEEKNLKQISDPQILEDLIHKTLTQYPKQLKEYQEGRTKLFGFFVGQIMKATQGQAHPEKLATLLKKKLEK